MACLDYKSISSGKGIEATSDQFTDTADRPLKSTIKNKKDDHELVRVRKTARESSNYLRPEHAQISVASRKHSQEDP